MKKLSFPLAGVAHRVWARRVVFALGAWLVLCLLAWLVVPGMVKREIEQRGSAVLGRPLTVGAVHFKPWTMELTLDQLQIAGIQGAAPAVTVGRIYVDAELESLWRLAPVVDAVVVQDPVVRLSHQGGGRYDVDDMLDRLSATSRAESSSKEAPARFAAYNIEIKGGSIDFLDAPVRQSHRVQGLQLSIPFVSTLDAKREVRVEPHLAFDLNGAHFDTAGHGSAVAQTRKGQARLQISKLNLAPYLPYLPAAWPVRVDGAVMDTDIHVDFVQSPHVAVQVSGALKVDSLRVRDASGAQLTGPAGAMLSLNVHQLHWPLSETQSAVEATLRMPNADQSVAQLKVEAKGHAQHAVVTATLQDASLEHGAAQVARFLKPRLRGVVDAQVQATWDQGKLRADVSQLLVRNVALLPASGSALAAADLPRFKSLEITDSQIDLTAQTVRLGRVVLTEPAATLRREESGQWIFADWLVPMETTNASTTPKPWQLSVADVQVSKGALVFADRAQAKPVYLEVLDVQLAAQEATLEGAKPMPITLSARMRTKRRDAGILAYQGNAMWSPVALQGNVQMQSLAAHVLAPYLADRLNLELLRAEASFKGQVRYAAAPAGNAVELRGDALLESFRANTVWNHAQGALSSEELLSWKSLNVPGIDFAMSPGVATRVRVKEAALADFYARIVVAESGRINLQDLVKKQDAAEPQSALPDVASTASAPLVQTLAPVIEIGPISVVNGKVLFSDRFIKPNYSADLTDLTGTLSGFSSQAQGGNYVLADLDLRGRAEGSAQLEVTGKLNPLAQPMVLDIRGRVRDLELPPLSAYAIKYAGYGIERGKLSVDVNYKVLPDGQLTATNSVVLNQLTFGDKVEGAPNSLPVKLAVALLADRNGVIDLDLPISGSLNDPQFSLGPVIFKVITNVIVKAITAPFSLLAKVFSGADDEMGAVAFAPGSSTLTDEAKASLDKVAKALVDRPTLRLTVTGEASLETDADGWRRERLLQAVLREKNRRAGAGAASVQPPTGEEYPVLLKEVYRRADIVKPRNLLGLAQDIGVQDMEALLMTAMPVTTDTMHELALQRSEVVKDYLASTPHLAPRLFLGAAKTIAPQPNWKPQALLGLTMD
jgi:uncharacterized protein involved in outer membrane biogenesis